MSAPMLAATLALCAGRNCTAQVRSTSPEHSAQESFQKRLDDLEKQVNILGREVASLAQNHNASLSSFNSESVATGPPAPSQETLPSSLPADLSHPATLTLAKLLGPTTLSGYLDAYYALNFNHPANLQSGLELFNTNTNQFSLNMVEWIADKAPETNAGAAGRAGYHVAFGYGQTGSGIIQAYSSYLAPLGKGLQIDFGKFVTTAGEEWAETPADWNYTRSLLFSYAIPYFHQGIRATYKLNNALSLQGSVVNGWNQVLALTSGKTYGANITWNPSKKTQLAETYYGGPQSEPGSPANKTEWRHLLDTIATYSPTAKWAFVLNEDYAAGDRVHRPPTLSAPASVSSPRDWWGVAAYAKYAWSERQSLAARYEYYGDPQGYTLFNALGFPGGHVQEITATFTRLLTNTLMTRIEYRGDFASRPVFDEGAANRVTEQNRLTLGVVYLLGSSAGEQ